MYGLHFIAITIDNSKSRIDSEINHDINAARVDVDIEVDHHSCV